MNIYTVYSKGAGTDQLENHILVPEGFSWMGALLHFFWAFYRRMWLTGGILLAIIILLATLQATNFIGADILQALRFGMLLFVGCNFNDWYRYSLTQRGFEFCGVVSGKNEDEASAKFIAEMLQRSTFGSGQGLPGLV